MRRAFLLLITLAACDGRGRTEAPITVFAAASLARPLAGIAESFSERSDVPVRVELGGSMELARRITDLGATPDVVLLADDEVVAALMPQHLDWYARFATSRLVVAYMPRSRHADSITTENWWRVVTRNDVTIGRADSALAPAGRHALALLRRAGGYYGDAGISARLLERAHQRFIRPNAAELAVLLETGEVDYIIDYEAVARQYGFRFVQLPTDLAPAVLYGASVPKGASNPERAVEFVQFLLGEGGRAALRGAEMDLLRIPVAIGTNVPAPIADLARTMTTAVPRP